MTVRMYKVIENEVGVPIKAWTKGVLLEQAAEKQVRNVASLPFIYKWVALMPDVHWGIGTTVGSVIPTKKAIIPAAVGVDIGCGMMAVKTTLQADHLPDNLRPLRTAIEQAVPHGRTNRGGKGDRGAWHHIPKHHLAEWGRLKPEYDNILSKHPKLDRGNDVNHLGSLGTGNHFIEICIDTNNGVWLMLHSGSRGVGNRIGTHFIELAKKDIMKWHINVPDKDLAYFPENLLRDLMNSVELDAIALAMKGKNQEDVDKVINNLPQKKQAMYEPVEGATAKRDVDNAQKAIVDAARQMEKDGRFNLEDILGSAEMVE